MTDPDPDLHLDILTEEIPAPPVGAPVDFRERLVLHLKTTAPDALAAAEAAYRGVWPGAHAYIAAQLAEHLPPFLHWLLAACDPDRLRRGYEAGELIVWTIPLSEGTAMVFESLRATELPEPDPEPDPDFAPDPDLEPDDPPCPQCGARDWTRYFHTDDRDHRLLGCDICRPDL